jgi:hypothetical protein
MNKNKIINELEAKLNIANNTVHRQMNHIEMLNKQLDQQDKAIERKDRQFLGLRCAYQDEIINKG